MKQFIALLLCTFFAAAASAQLTQGCTDGGACNFDPTAAIDDGSCIYPDYYWYDGDQDGYGGYQFYGCASSYPGYIVPEGGDCHDGRTDMYPGAPGLNQGNDNDCSGVIEPDEECISTFCNDPNACNYDPLSTCEINCTYPGCTDPLACNYQWWAGCDNGTCCYAGCTNWTACNYDAAACCDDGSCIVPEGCNDPLACNYDPAATCYNAYFCCYGNCMSVQVTGGTFPGQIYWVLYMNGYTYWQGGAPYNQDLGCVPHGCGYLYLSDAQSNGWQGAQITITINGAVFLTATLAPEDGSYKYIYFSTDGEAGCTDVTACNYSPTATCDDGTCTYGGGCTDPAACNFNPNAVCSLDICSYPGCIDNNAINYDPTAQCGSNTLCVFPTSCSDPNACNYGPIEGEDYVIINYGYCGSWGDIYSTYRAYIVIETLQEATYPGMYLLGSDGAGTYYYFSYDQYNGPQAFQKAIDLGENLVTINSQAENDLLSSYTCAAFFIGLNDVNVEGTHEWSNGDPVIFTNWYVGGEPNNYPYEFCRYPGCTDPIACNYYWYAACDDGSCLYNAGCTNPSACNYDAQAQCENGTCQYPGCNDPLACNYYYYAGCDDGSCLYICGCNDIIACNYEPLAEYNDGSCTYPGCTDPTACNYWYGYGCDNGTCTYPGCADVYALNYNPSAGCQVYADCIYPDICSDPNSCNPGPNPDEQYCLIGHFGTEQWVDAPYFYVSPFVVEQVNASPGTFANMTYLGSITNHHYFISNYSTNGPGAFADAVALGLACVTINSAFENNTVWNWVLQQAWIGLHDIDDDDVFNWQSGTSAYFDWAPGDPNNYPIGNMCVYPGCTDPVACNFNYYAGCDDGSCYYPGCTDSYACNYDPAAGCNYGTCIYPGCTDPLAANYWSGYGCDDGSCYYYGCMDVNACNYDPIASYQPWWYAVCTYPGCNDTEACNYNSYAGCDDGSCTYGNDYLIDVSFDGICYYCSSWYLYDENGNYITSANPPSSLVICLPDGCYSLVLYSPYGYDASQAQFNMWQNGQLIYSQNWPGTAYSTTYYIPLGPGADCSFAGCNDPLACNYDPAATVDDGSCYYPYALYEDLDLDGYGSAVVIDPAYCDYNINGWPANTSTQTGDCNDNDNTIHPYAYEYCDGIDNNCDGSLDNGQGSYYYADSDGDGYGNPYDYIYACEPDATHFLADYGDCNDNNPEINPSGVEVCNDMDDDCDGYIDEIEAGLLFTTDASWDNAVYPNPYSCYGTNPFFIDGYQTSSIWGTTHPSTLISKTFNYTIQPGVTVLMHGFEDDGLSIYLNGQLLFSQYDYGVSYFPILDLTPYLVNGDNLIQVQLYDAYGCGDFAAVVYEQQPAAWYADYDGDGYGNPAVGNSECNAPSGYVNNDDDCDDYNYYIHPNAAEACNDVDDDCDGLVDDNDPDMQGGATWYADVDGDGFGDANSTLVTCDPPSDYASNSDDCDDNDPLEFPNAVWYTDNDQDGYGTGAYQYACIRPTGTNNINELASISGDCDDNNPAVNPGSQYFQLTNNGVFSDAACYPTAGSTDQLFQFQIEYFNTNGNLPPSTYPRVLIDLNGNGIPEGTDQLIIMNEEDNGDDNTADGKIYSAHSEGLGVSTSWQTWFIVEQGACATTYGPLDYPDVLDPIDLEIFASDIALSAMNPEVSSPLTVTATVHNPSDYSVGSFAVHLENQYDNMTWPDQMVGGMAPHSSTEVTWTITTPAEPAWCPLQVTIDFNNVIEESNELDNSAIRPFINGDFNLPGGIATSCFFSPQQVIAGYPVTIYGHSDYYGTAIPLLDPSVAGAQVTFTIVETGASFSTYTNSGGNFAYTLSAPGVPGIYHAVGEVTDFTLTGTFECSFEVVSPPTGCESCDISCLVSLSDLVILQGESVLATFYVYSSCNTENLTVLDINQSGGTPDNNYVIVPPMLAGETFTFQSTLTFNDPGYYSICGVADAAFFIEECSEGNNYYCEYIQVLPAYPDITPISGPGGWGYICGANDQIGFTLYNGGGVPSGDFDCEVRGYLNGNLVDTQTHTVVNIDPLGYYGFNLGFDFTAAGDYCFEIDCDIPLPNGTVAETNENNNSGTWCITQLPCAPDLYFAGCPAIVIPTIDPAQPGSVHVEVNMVNGGNDIAYGPIQVLFELSNGNTQTTTYNGNLSPGQTTLIGADFSTPNTVATVTVTVDSGNNVAESSEYNSTTATMCYEFAPSMGPYNDCILWNTYTYLPDQAVYPAVGVYSLASYIPSDLQIRFEVSGPGLAGTINLGNTTLNNIPPSCYYCPYFTGLPNAFTFPEEGCYTFTITVDPLNEYPECDESNNVIILEVCASALPDMRVLSEFIAPSLLNPEPGEPVTFNVTYENIGFPNVNDLMNLQIMVDEIVIDQVNDVPGLGSGNNNTVAIGTPWSSMLPGIHIIRTIIDSDNEIVELDEMNNEATRAIVVGQSSNFYFVSLQASNENPSLGENISFTADIGNNGDLANEADVQLSYVTNSLDTIPFDIVHVWVDANSSALVNLSWTVQDASTTIVGEILNAVDLEYTYVDNTSEIVLGGLQVLFITEAAPCNGNGIAEALVSGGVAPYTVLWQNGFIGDLFTSPAGDYDLSVIDATGQLIHATVTIPLDAPSYYADEDEDGFGDPEVFEVSCTQPLGYVSNNLDCDDTNATMYPGASGTHEGIDNNCNGTIGPNEFLPCDGDFNFDGIVNVSDMLLFMSSFGCNSSCGAFDLTEDGVVNVSDMLLFMSAFGTSCL